MSAQKVSNLQCIEFRDGEVFWKPDFEPPPGALRDPYGIDRRGIISWKNPKNGFFVGAIHFTAFPKKRSIQWFREETRIFKPWQIDREYNISFKSRAGSKAFAYLLENEERYRIPNMDLALIPKNWRIIAGLDYGTTNPTSIHFYAVDPLRRIYSIYEFYKPSNVREIARVLKGVHKGPNIDGVWTDFTHPLWKRCEKLIVDGAIYNKNQETGGEEMTSIGQLLEEQGIYGIERADKSQGSRVAGLSRLHDLMAPPEPAVPGWKPSFYFCRSCEHQWKEFTSLVYAELPEHSLLNKNLPEDIVPKDDHAYDEARYVAMAVAAPSDEAPPPVPEEGTLGAVEREWDLEDAGRDTVDFF